MGDKTFMLHTGSAGQEAFNEALLNEMHKYSTTYFNNIKTIKLNKNTKQLFLLHYLKNLNTYGK